MKRKYTLKSTEQTRPRGIIFLVILAVIALLISIATVLILPIVAEQPQEYLDIIVESLAMGNLNKSGELNLFWASMLLSGILMLMLDKVYISRRKTPCIKGNGAAVHSTFWKGLAILLFPNLVIYLISGSVSVFIIFLCIQYYVLMSFRPSVAFKGIVLSASLYYSLLALVAICNLTDIRLKITQTLIEVIATVFGAIICVAVISREKENLLDRIILFLQIPIPALLLVYLVDRYEYRGEILTIPYPTAYYFLINTLVVGLLGYAIWKIFRLKSTGALLRTNDIVLLSTVMTVFIFHSFSAPGRFFPTDWHHTGEQMLPWQQVFEQGQRLYDTYSPASGLFPMVVGFFQNVVLDGTVTSYSAAIALMTILFSGITMMLCYFVAGGELAFIIAVFLGIPGYDRPYMIIPSLLLLLLPRLIRNRNLWLQCWIFLCFLGGLYYPTYGGAILIATLPFGLVQLWLLIRSRELRKLIKKPAFYITWVVFLTPIVICLPLLLRMAHHVLLYASQTLCADAIPIYGAAPPAAFFPYIPQQNLRLALYYAARMAIPVLAVLVFVYMLYLYLARSGSSFFRKLMHPAFLGFTAGMGVLVIAYTFTLVRMDPSVLLARTGPVVLLVGGILLSVIIWKYGKLVFRPEARYSLIGIALGVAFVLGGLRPDTEHLFYCYSVGEEMERIDSQVLQPVPRAGVGFMTAPNKELLLSYASTFSKNDFANYPILNLADQLAYYPLNLRASATGTTFIAKSAKAQQQIIKVLEEENPLIYRMSTSSYYYWYFSLSNYYIYRWMMDNNYVLGPDDLYMPQELAANYYGKDYESNRRSYRMMDNNLGNISSSLGRSMDSLRPQFSTSKVSAQLIETNGITWQGEDAYISNQEIPDSYFLYQFDQKVDGRDADFLYLELDTSINLERPTQESWLQRLTKNTKGENFQIRVYWECEEENISDSLTLVCNYGDGKLLLPLGSHPGWLLSQNTKIRIDFEGSFMPGDRVSIKKMEFLRMNM